MEFKHSVWLCLCGFIFHSLNHSSRLIFHAKIFSRPNGVIHYKTQNRNRTTQTAEIDFMGYLNKTINLFYETWTEHENKNNWQTFKTYYTRWETLWVDLRINGSTQTTLVVQLNISIRTVFFFDECAGYFDGKVIQPF